MTGKPKVLHRAGQDACCHVLCLILRRVGLALTLSLMGACQAVNAAGLLRVHPSNPRYFTDDSGRAIHLAGHQWFNDVQHTAWNRAMTVDWERYLDFLDERGMNYLRNWVIWSTGNPHDDIASPEMPFARTGPGLAADGLPRFDLTRFNEGYFRTICDQVAAAERRNIYISVMLFEVYGFLDREGFWKGNVLHGSNNINDIDVDTDRDGNGMEFFYSDDRRVQEIQRRYVRKLVEALNSFDNVFFEIANELHAPAWQLEILQLVKEAEARLPKQHLVYLSPGGRDRAGNWLLSPKTFASNSAADVISVARGWDPLYRGNPPVEAGRRPVVMDMDHVAAGSNDGDNEWNNSPLTPWKLFTRGYHICIYDHDYWKPTARGSAWDETRQSCGATVHLAARIPLAAMRPCPELSSTEYCLAQPGVEYVVLQPDVGNVTVRGLERKMRYDVEWLTLTSAGVKSSARWTATDAVGTFPATSAPVVLHLRRSAD